MIFLGAASNYKASDIARHTFALGLPRHSEQLRTHLSHRYDVISERVALYHTGRSALAAAIRATTPKGSKVLINGFTCYAVVQAVKRAGCTPIFADITPDTLHYDADELRRQLKSHPDIRAIIVQNTFGIPVDIVALEAIANRHHLAIIEDLAHCTGTHYADGRETGTVGAAAALSFGKGKSIDTISGGALILRDANLPSAKQPTRRPPLSDSLRDRWYPFLGACIRGSYHLHIPKLITGALLKLHFIQRSADATLNTTMRLTHWQARLALRQFRNLSDAGRPPLRKHYFVNNRDELLTKLAKSGYHLGEFWYERPVSPERYYAKVHFPEADCPNAVQAAASIVNLPTWYPEPALKPALKIIKEYQQ